MNKALISTALILSSLYEGFSIFKNALSMIYIMRAMNEAGSGAAAAMRLPAAFNGLGMMVCLLLIIVNIAALISLFKKEDDITE